MLFFQLIISFSHKSVFTSCYGLIALFRTLFRCVLSRQLKPVQVTRSVRIENANYNAKIIIITELS